MPDLTGCGFSAPPDVRDVVEFHWWHVPVGGSLVLVVLSVEPVWYVGHFAQGRMRRCRGDLCRACVDGVGRQIRYVVCAAEVSSRQIGMLEVGSAPMLHIRDRALARGGLRGMILDVSRPARSKHGRLEVSVFEESPPSWSVTTEALDLRMVLERTWAREVGTEPKAVSPGRRESAHSESR
jgi:hypothetical protein